jgi:membrane associated rhomboid family serine protease
MGPITRSLILLNLAIFLLQGALGETLLTTFALWPLGRFEIAELHTAVGFHVWQLFTYAFLHGNLLHLALNMFALYMFGRDVERELSARQYLFLYAGAVLSAGAGPISNPPALGAIQAACK